MLRFLKFGLLFLGLGLSTVDPSFVHAQDGMETQSRDRNADIAALKTKLTAINQMDQILKTRRGTAQEHDLTVRQLVLLTEAQIIAFRISNSPGPDQIAYKQQFDLLNRKSFALTSEFITRFPKSPKVAKAYFLRGKSLKDANRLADAAKDFEMFISLSNSKSEGYMFAGMLLSDIYVATNDLPRAVAALRKLEVKENDPVYPSFMRKLSVGYSSIPDYPGALYYQEREIQYYIKNNQLGDGNLKKAYANIALYHGLGIEKKLPNFSVNIAFAHFQKLAQGKLLANTLISFAAVLRSKGMKSELNEFKGYALSSPSLDTAGKAQILAMVVEEQLNNRKYAELERTAYDIYQILASPNATPMDAESAGQLRSAIKNGIARCQDIVAKAKGLPEADSLGRSLITFYSSLLKITPVQDPEISLIRFNLAELYFSQKQYPYAVNQYLWILKYPPKEDKIGIVNKSKKQIILAQYEGLKKDGKISEKIEAVAFSAEKPDAIDPRLNEWIKSIDQYVETKAPDADEFRFESDRSLYHFGKISQAMQRFQDFITRFPKSKFAGPVSILMLDTYIASEKWEEISQFPSIIQKSQVSLDAQTLEKLNEIAANSTYKLIELDFQAKKSDQVIKRVDAFLVAYPKHSKIPAALAYAGQSATALGNLTLAQHYFTTLTSQHGQSEGASVAYFHQAKNAESNYQFQLASDYYSQFLASQQSQRQLKPDERLALRNKVAMLSLLSGDPVYFSKTVTNKAICNTDNAIHCDQMKAYSYLANPDVGVTSDVTKYAVQVARIPTRSDRWIWTAIGLKAGGFTNPAEQAKMIEYLNTDWEKQDGFSKLISIPAFTISSSQFFDNQRKVIRQQYPIKLDEVSIKKRSQSIQTAENFAMIAIKAPWARAQAEILHRMALIYFEAGEDFFKIAPPPGIVGEDLKLFKTQLGQLALPFQQKGLELLNKSWEIATQRSIDTAHFRLISDTYTRLGGEEAAKKRFEIPPTDPKPLNLALVDEVDSQKGWSTQPGDKDPFLRIKSGWSNAIRNKNLLQAAFFMQEATSRKDFLPEALTAARGVTLAVAGAKAEGLDEFKTLSTSLSGPRKSAVDDTLGSNFLFTLAYDIAKSYGAQVPTVATTPVSGEDTSLRAPGSTPEGTPPPSPPTPTEPNSSLPVSEPPPPESPPASGGTPK